jgi:tRNA isopentenyl-2-thiomethyl-A-37 hydroxylase MiaE
LRGTPDEADLAAFYTRLADAESRHWEMFRDLASAHGPADGVQGRLRAMAAAEAEIVGELPLGPRMH